MKNYSFNPTWPASLLFLIALSLFVSLGFWQLQRAEEKQNLNEQRNRRGQDAYLELRAEANLDLDELRYRPVRIEGEYDVAHQFLVDNQLHEQRAGYHVLTPLRLSGGQAILVNRGWIATGPDRRTLPDVALVPSPVRISGTLDRLHRVGYRLKNMEIPSPGWPSLVQLPDPEQMAERLGYPVRPYQVLLAADEPNGYTRTWHTARLDPGKNLGYALQWFLFAACATIFFVRHGLKSREQNRSDPR